MPANSDELPLPTSSFGGIGGGGGRTRVKFLMNPTSTKFISSLVYILVSLTAVYLNKLLYSYSEYKFPYPFFTVLFQLVITFIVMNVWSRVDFIHIPYLKIPVFQWDSNVAIRVAPLTIVYMCVIIFNPLFLQHVEVSTYHFSHSLVIAFSILFSQLMLNTNTSSRVQTACLIVMFGLCVGSMGDLNFSLVGAFYALAWPAVVAIYGIYVKKTLMVLKNEFWSMIQYNTAMSIVVLVPFVLLSGELDEVFSSVWFWDQFGFWLQMIITSLTGLSVNVAMMILLTHASPLSLAVSSVTKTVLQSFIAALVFGNHMSLLNLSGMLISLAGSCYYALTRSGEMKL